MRISDYIKLDETPNMVFFHCNPRHHSLAFLQAKPPKKINHFMIQLKSLDDVGSTYYLCEREGVPITASLGKHTNDHMVSFYMRSPSGFQIEYGWGAREVDDNTWQVQKHTKGSIWGHEGLGA